MSLYSFYRSKEWEIFRQVVIDARRDKEGFIYDEITGKKLVEVYDIILHHVIELTEENYTDANISLNPDNIQIVSHKTHNIIHNKLGYSNRQVYLVYGSPLSGKSSFVATNMEAGDLVVDIDSIWQCVSGCERFIKPNALKSVVFDVRDTLIERVKYRRGKWNNAYIIGGYPFKAERERLIDSLQAREIFIDTCKDICIERLLQDEKRNKEEWLKFINDWWLQYEGGY